MGITIKTSGISFSRLKRTIQKLEEQTGQQVETVILKRKKRRII